MFYSQAYLRELQRKLEEFDAQRLLDSSTDAIAFISPLLLVHYSFVIQGDISCMNNSLELHKAPVRCGSRYHLQHQGKQ